jgi:hypothetical protein
MTVYGKAVINVIMHTLAKNRRSVSSAGGTTVDDTNTNSNIRRHLREFGGMSLNINKSGMLFRLNLAKCMGESLLNVLRS